MKRKSWITVLAACLFIALLALLGACGESKPKRYRVTAESGEGYTVSGLAQDGYEEGAQVSFTVTVTDETKEIDAVTSADVAVADKGEGAYGFTMPAKDVTVSVTLKDRSITPPPIKYLVTVASGEGYTVEGLTAEGYEEGAQVSFSVVVTDETKEIESVASADVNVEDKGDGVYGFVMPAKAVAVTVTLKTKEVTPPSTYTVSFDPNAPEGVEVDGTVGAITVNAGGSVTIPDGTYTADGWLFAGWADAPDHKADLTQGDLHVGEEYTPTASITLYACWLKGYNDALGQSDDVIYVGTSVLGFGSAVRVSGETKKLGFAEIDQETGTVTGFTFYYEETEGGDVVGLITEDGYVLRDDASMGSFLQYNYVTGEPEAYILTLDGYQNGIVSHMVGEQVQSDYGLYEYDPEAQEYLFLYLDPVTHLPIGEYEGFYFILVEEAIPEMENLKGYFIQCGEEYGSYILYDDGYLMDTAIYLDGYGGAVLYTANGAEEKPVFTDIGHYYGTENYVGAAGEWEYSSSQTNSTFRFTLNYVLDEDGSYIQIYVLFDETHSGTFNEKNGTGTLTLDGYGQAVYTSEGGTFEGVVVFGDTLCTFYVYDETFEFVDTLYFNIDWDNQEFSLNTDDFVIDGTVLIEYKGTSRNITIPDGVTEIADKVFYGLDVLSVVIPASVTKIGANVFQNNNTLTRVTFLGTDPDAIEIDWAAANDPFRWPAGGFVIVVPEENVEAFRTAWSEAWTAAGRKADLYTIKGSVEVDMRPEFEVNAEGVLIAYNRPSDSSSTGLVISKGQTEYGGEEITITAIAEDVFMGNTWLTSIDLGGVTTIGAGAFENCTALERVIFTNVTAIGEAAFAGCTALTGENGKIDLPAIVTIGASAFSGCTGIDHITVGEHIESIEALAFMEIATEVDHGMLYLELTGGTPPTIASGERQGAFTGNQGIGYRIIVPSIDYAKACWDKDNGVYGTHLMMKAGDEAGEYFDGTSDLILNGRAEALQGSVIWLYEIEGNTITFYSADAAENGYAVATGTYENKAVTVEIDGTEYCFTLAGTPVTFVSDDELYTLVVQDTRELNPDTWSAKGETKHSITVTLNGKEATLAMDGYNTKTIEDFEDTDGKHYQFEITLPTHGNVFTYKKTQIQFSEDLEFDSTGYIKGLTCDDGSTLNLHKGSTLVFVYGTLVNVDGHTLSFSDNGTICTLNGNVVTFTGKWLDTPYSITVTVDMAAKTFTYTWEDVTPAPTKYTVTVSGEGVTASGLAADGYASGTKVTFTLTVTDDTKEIDTVTSSEVTIADDGNGTYSFTMPEKNVTVTVTLKDKTTEPTDNVYTGDLTYTKSGLFGSSTVYHFTSITIDTSKEVTTAHITVTVNEADKSKDFELDKATLANYNGEGTAKYYYEFWIDNAQFYLAVLEEDAVVICDADDAQIDNNKFVKGGAVAPTTYTLTFALGEHAADSATAPAAQTLEANATYTLPDAPDAAEGWEFDGWGEEKLAAGSTYTMPASDTTLTAQWKEVKSEPEPTDNVYTGDLTYTLKTGGRTYHFTSITIDTSKEVKEATIQVTVNDADKSGVFTLKDATESWYEGEGTAKYYYYATIDGVDFGLAVLNEEDAVVVCDTDDKQIDTNKFVKGGTGSAIVTAKMNGNLAILSDDRTRTA